MKIDPVTRFDGRWPPPQPAGRLVPGAGPKLLVNGQKYSRLSRRQLLGVRREQKPQTAGSGRSKPPLGSAAAPERSRLDVGKQRLLLPRDGTTARLLHTSERQSD